ncbi:PIG-L deacetylase family protein [Rhizorhapis sp. SPR117]|uniref:PIG-L deacetylase family protein n=1 Tax=Rhizorhapis sp. SPR117 TaxID=2912611 RepID=UPI001F3B5938|nr:PIG-L family deacetylase [Rhizorhapis sp. SPR117]
MLSTIKRALVIAPHPDDEVLGCGGTISRLTDGGAQVDVCIVTRAGTDRFAPGAAEKSVEEAHSAHAELGVTGSHFLKLPAAELDRIAHADMNAAFCNLVSTLKPDTLFVPFIGDVHLDHQLSFLSAMVAARPRGPDAPQRIFAYETLSETNWYAPGVTAAFIPNVFVDISAHITRKIQAFRCYASQVRPFPDERSIKAIEALATMRGATVYRQAAEAFIAIRQIE